MSSKKEVKADEKWLQDRGMENLENELTKVEVPCVLEPLAEPKEEVPRLKTGTILDDILGGGGLESGRLVELYGEYASGKTQIIFTLTVEAADQGMVVFVDVENTFSRRRLLQIAKARGKDPKKISEHILLYKPMNIAQQLAIPYKIPDPLPAPLKLIVVDSLLALFRAAPSLQGREHLTLRQQWIRNHMTDWKTLAQKHSCIVVYSNQVYDRPVASPFLPAWCNQESVGGHTVAHIGDFRIFLRKSSGNVRIARLVDNSEIPLAERAFQINEKGIDDLSPDQQELAKKKLERWEEEQSAGMMVKTRGKKRELSKEEIVALEAEAVKEGEAKEIIQQDAIEEEDSEGPENE